MPNSPGKQVNPLPDAVAAGILFGIGRAEEEDDRLQEDANPDDDEKNGIMAVIPVPDPAQIQEPEE